MKKLLVCGLPRSGSTWISKVLSANASVQYLHEPDNERQNLLSFIYKDKLPRFPLLKADDKCPKYKTLFQKAYDGYYLQPYGKLSNVIRDMFGLTVDELEQRIQENNELQDHEQTPANIRDNLITISIQLASYSRKVLTLTGKDYDTVVLKSVHCLLALEFLMSQILLDEVLVIYRHPASIVASHLRMDNNDIWRPFLYKERLLSGPLADFKSDIEQINNPVEKAGATIGAVYHIMEQQRKQLDFKVTKYEFLCRDKIPAFQQLYDQLGLRWSQQVEDYIQELDTPGAGYSVQRVAQRQINKWRRELSESQIASVKRGYQIFSPGLEYKF